MNELENVKIGNYLYYRENYSDRIRIEKVDRLTKTQIICGISKYRKDDGRKVGASDWSTVYVRPVNEDIIKEYYLQNLRIKYQNLKIEVTEENYDELYKIYNELIKYKIK